MPKKKIIYIGLDVPGIDDSNKDSLTSKISLLDYDIIVIDPSIYQLIGYSYDSYLGKPSLSDSASFRLKETIEHWRREILDATKAGKTVIILLNGLREVYIATGDKSHSGTGRNRVTTRHVTLYNNYNLIPGKIKVLNSKGKSMRLSKRDNALVSYWNELGESSEFRVLLEVDGIRSLIETKSGNKTVGGYLKYKNSPGLLFLLPYIDFEKDELITENEDGFYWNDTAIQMGKRFEKSIVELDKKFQSKNEFTPIPDWAEHDSYVLPKEKKIRSKLLSLEKEHEKIQNEKEKYTQELSNEMVLKFLLYENGKLLETAIHEALKLLGFETSQYHDSESEFDVVFESKEGRLLGEAEGKDNKPININKLRQLEMNIHEDFERDEVTEIAKGVLIGNAYRLQQPNKREDFFTTKCLKAAERSGTALIKSTDLFMVSKYLSGKNDKTFAKKCRTEIINTTGVVNFPTVPEGKEKIESKAVD